MTIVEAPRAVTGGIDTHGEVHVAAVLDEVGGLLGTQSFRADPDGYAELLSWLEAFGEVSKVGVEGTGSYGAGVARFLARAGVHVVEVDRQNRQARRQSGKSDPLDALEAARAAQRAGPMEGPRAETVRSRPSASSSWPSARLVGRASRRSAQMRQLTFSAPDQLQSRLKGLPIAAFVAAAQGLRPTEHRGGGQFGTTEACLKRVLLTLFVKYALHAAQNDQAEVRNLGSQSFDDVTIPEGDSGPTRFRIQAMSV